MGRIVDAFEYHDQELVDSGKLIVFCNNNNADEGISLNVPLAEKLKEVSPTKRNLQMEKYISEIIDSHEESLIKDFDILFNPIYKIDLLQIFINLKKTKDISIRWPGELKENRLIYAEPEYDDYKTFTIDNYDIICVK